MKKILLSLLTIGVVSAGVFGATKAFFTDTETSTGNTFSAGTIDIEVDGTNPWTRSGFTLADMKPSQTDYIDFVVHNVGTNPVNLFKTLKNFAYSDPEETVTEPECEAEKGTWSSGSCSNRTKVDNIDTQINYDLKVELYNGDPSSTGKLVWWETIYTDSDNIKLSVLKDNPLYLGMIPAGWYMKVKQSYHMIDASEDNQNQYQSDSLSFDIVLDGEQLGVRALRLENKEEVQYGGYSHTILGDGKYAELTYKVKDRVFTYTINVYGMADGTYTLIRYDDPLDGSDPWPAPNSLALANVTVSGGSGTASGSIELGRHLLNSKIWLVKQVYTPGSTTGPLTWDPTNMLFETGLMDYYDADL